MRYLRIRLSSRYRKSGLVSRRLLWIGTAILLGAALAVNPAIDAAVGDIDEFPIGGGNPQDITPGPDGNLWFVMTSRHAVGRITTKGALTFFPIAGLSAQGITAGADRALWLTEVCFGGACRIFRVTTGGAFTTFTIPSSPSFAVGITAGPDENIWFVEQEGNRIGRLTRAGSFREFPIPTANSKPFDITPGPDGNLWFVEREADQIGRITPTGRITEFPIPPPLEEPLGIAGGPDGNLWFTASRGNGIGRITVDGVITVFPHDLQSPTQGIAAGPDGNLWFTVLQNSRVGRMTPSGDFTSFPIPSGQVPGNMSHGPDGNLWFVEPQDAGDSIGRVEAIAPRTGYVAVIAPGFSPKNRTVKQGQPVQWSFYGPNPQSATDSSGMGLFDSGTKTLVSYFSFEFIAAGTYPYNNAQETKQKGTVKVPMIADPESGDVGTTFKITWSAKSPPAGYVFDVEIKRPTGGFVPFQTGVTSRRADFVPDAGPGTYQFRGRLRNTVNGNASNFSPAKSIDVTP